LIQHIFTPYFPPNELRDDELRELRELLYALLLAVLDEALVLDALVLDALDLCEDIFDVVARFLAYALSNFLP
jgi:hypothetical protein